jgi:hypothetical protein
VKIVKIRPKYFNPVTLIHLFASNRTTLLLLVGLALGIIVYYQITQDRPLWMVLVPTLLLVVNFLLALFTRGILKTNWALMLFHFSLIALVILVLMAQMTYLKATLELTTNEMFSGQLENVRRGPWHRFGLTQARFTNLGFQIRYHKGIKRDKTLNQIQVINNDGRNQIIEIGDHVPLVIGHYRFYTSHNKGYAPVFEWHPSDSTEIILGGIHLPAYPVHEYRQALEWKIPGSARSLWTFLNMEDDVLPEDRAFDFQVPEKNQLIVRYQDQRHELRPGDQLTLPEGVLRYQKLSTWMGYKVDYDWTRPWLLATALIGLLGLFMHFILKFIGPLITRNESAN